MTVDLLPNRSNKRFQTIEELESYKKQLWAEYTYEFGDFTFIWPPCEVTWGEKRIHLTFVLSDILKTILDAWPRYILGKEIAQNLSTRHSIEDSYVRVYVRRLRQTLLSPDIILSNHHGYKFNAEGVLRRTVQCL